LRQAALRCDAIIRRYSPGLFDLPLPDHPFPLGELMDLIALGQAVVLGIVEGLTEFLPVSSTGHLILADALIGFADRVGEGTATTFEIAIQSGAMVAIIIETWARLWGTLVAITRDKSAQRFALNVFIAFLPAAVFGVLFSKMIKAQLFHPVPVALAFVVGGLVILWVERRIANNAAVVRINSVDDMSPVDALKVGLAQCAALIPGTSRSGATIIGGMLFGISRKVATEFSFYLAVPTLIGAGVYSLYKARDVLSVNDVPLFTVGTLVAFASAWWCVRWLIRYVATHDFRAFAWYRIVFGAVILAAFTVGGLHWS
jgi:undecaprenyl-diphosphatase